MKNRAWTVLGNKGRYVHFRTGEEANFDWGIFDEEVVFDRYSGINDIVGAEIYENDVITATIPGFAGGTVTALVIFAKGMFCVKGHYDYIPLHSLVDIKISDNQQRK